MFKYMVVIMTIVSISGIAFSGDTNIRVVDKPDTEAGNDFYVGNRAPLTSSPLIKLPVGSIKPNGWVRRQLELQRDGFHGHLTEISQFLKKEGNAWLSPSGEGDHGWEEPPYWLKGFSNCGYIGAGQPERRRLVRAGQRKERCGYKVRRPRGPLAEYDNALLPAGLL